MKYLFGLSLALCLGLLSYHAEAQNVFNPAMTTEVPDEAIQPGELRLLSYNIQMLPRFIGRTHRGPLKRARLIPAKLIEDKIDIIVFQEAFDVRARRLLKRRLKKTYPYEIGPANESFPFIITNSGVQIYSKIPLKKVEDIRYKNCESYDCMARKGALLVEGEWQGQKFQILGTHIQAPGPDWIKETQFEAIEKELLEPYKQDGVPVIIAGDFNTGPHDTALYAKLTGTLKCENGLMYGMQYYTCDGKTNSMMTGGPSNCNMVDYIFWRGNGVQPYSLLRTVKMYKQQWHKKYSDLSDHYGILARIIFKKPETKITQGN